MSRSCAKPTCSSPAVSWFDMQRESCEVTRSSFPTDQGMAFCQVHADRFTVPNGWSLSLPVTDSSEDTASSVDAVEPALIAPADAANSVVGSVVDSEATTVDAEPIEAIETVVDEKSTREHDRENPWFVPDSTNPNDDFDSTGSLANPSEGSLLHRAFNGPTSPEDDTGAAVSQVAPVDELSPRRRARSSSDDAEEESTGRYREFELPFPPHSRTAAVV